MKGQSVKVKVQVLERERERQGLSVNKLAERSGIHRNTYARIRKVRKAEIETIYRLCEALNVNIGNVIL